MTARIVDRIRKLQERARAAGWTAAQLSAIDQALVDADDDLERLEYVEESLREHLDPLGVRLERVALDDRWENRPP